MIWLPIGIVIGVVLTVAAGIAFATAGRKLERRDRRLYERYVQFVSVVGMQCAHLDRVAVVDHTTFDGLWPYYRAMCVEPSCVPASPYAAALEFVLSLRVGKAAPGWVRYVPERL